MINTPSKTPVSIPPTAPVPMERLPSADPPVAHVKGSSPTINANEVIKIVAAERLAYIAAASRIHTGTSSLYRVLNNQYGIFCKQSDQHNNSNLYINIIFNSGNIDEKKYSE